MEMILFGVMCGVTLSFAALLFKVHSLSMIYAYSRLIVGIDMFVLAGGIVIAWVKEISWEELALWVGLFMAFAGMQQEIIQEMKEMFVAFVEQHADNAYFVIDEVVADDKAVGWVRLDNGDDDFVCAALCVDDEVKKLSSEYEYRVSLYISYDLFGQPNTLRCRLASESDEE